MSLRDQINDDLKAAMRSGETMRRDTIRLLTAALKQREVDERIMLDDTQVLAVVEKMIKQRRESVKQYEAGARQDLADIETAEIAVIQEFMPQALSAEELAAIISKAMSDSGAASVQDMGKVMNLVRPLVIGRADMAAVSQLIKQQLSER